MAAGAACAVLLAAAATASNPLDRVIAVRIERQPLDEALRALAKQANLQILFDAELVTGRTAPLVREHTSPRLVLDRWLAGTRLIVEERAPGVIVVRQGDPGPERTSERR